MKDRETIRDVVCPFCSLLCDDLRVERRGRALKVTGNTCARARKGFERSDPELECHVRGRPATVEQAADHAARLLRDARQPLLAGMAADVAGCRAAAALAERCGAIVDHVHGEATHRNLRVLQSRGWFLTTLAEVANRADLVILVGTDTRENYPRFLERWAGPTPSLARRKGRTIFYVGPAGARLPDGSRSIPCTREQVGDVIGVLRTLHAGREPGKTPAWLSRALPGLRELAGQLRSAAYTVFVWSPGELDPVGGDLVIHDVCELVADINRTTRAAGLSLAGNDGGATCQSVLAWQYGFPMRVGFARGAPEYDPLLNAAGRALDEGGIDAMVWLNAFNPDLDPPRTRAPLIALTRPSPRLAGEAEVYFPVAVPGLDHGGAMFRTDNVVSMPLRGLRPPAARRAADILEMIADRV